MPSSFLIKYPKTACVINSTQPKIIKFLPCLSSHNPTIICTFQVPQTIPEPVHMYLLLFDNYLLDSIAIINHCCFCPLRLCLFLILRILHMPAKELFLNYKMHSGTVLCVSFVLIPLLDIRTVVATSNAN